MSRARTIAALALAGSLLAPALAHSPAVLDAARPYVVADATISRALYGEFLRGDEVFVATLSFKEDFALPVELFVPHRASLERHRPAWALVGPGLPAPLADERAALPRALPDGAGAIVDLNRVEPRPVFYEFVTRRFFWSTGALGIVVPQGDYEIWMWSPGKTTGKFGIGFGVEEKIDMVDALADWGSYAY